MVMSVSVAVVVVVLVLLLSVVVGSVVAVGWVVVVMVGGWRLQG